MRARPGRPRGRPKKVTIKETDGKDFPREKKKRKKGAPEITREEILEMRKRSPVTDGRQASKWDDNLEYVYACFRHLVRDWEVIHDEHNWKVQPQEREWKEHWLLALTVLEDRRNSSGWAGGEKLSSLDDYPQPELSQSVV